MEVALRQLAGLEVELELLERGVGGLLASQQDLEVLRKVEGLIITELLSQQRVGDEANRQKREHHSEQGTYHVIRSLPDGRPQWHRLRRAIGSFGSGSSRAVAPSAGTVSSSRRADHIPMRKYIATAPTISPTKGMTHPTTLKPVFVGAASTTSPYWET